MFREGMNAPATFSFFVPQTASMPPPSLPSPWNASPGSGSCVARSSTRTVRQIDEGKESHHDRGSILPNSDEDER